MTELFDLIKENFELRDRQKLLQDQYDKLLARISKNCKEIWSSGIPTESEFLFQFDESFYVIELRHPDSLLEDWGSNILIRPIKTLSESIEIVGGESCSS